jgi:hypothetical protein
MNNYTATISIADTQNGGDNYAFEVSWRAEPVVATAPAPFFDDVRACQDLVRQRFATQNGRGSYIDFETFADRQRLNQNPGGERGQAQNRGRNRDQETIQGRGSARSRDESSSLTYSCVVDTDQAQVLSGSYQLSNTVRTNDRTRLR